MHTCAKELSTHAHNKNPQQNIKSQKHTQKSETEEELTAASWA